MEWDMQYSWFLNNMGLNCVGSLICTFFSIVNTTVLHNSWSAESSDMETYIERNHIYGELWIQQTNCKLYADFCAEGQCPYQFLCIINL